jgi:aerobic-type carbon monoxide dehydrogenase small subunit (CoxS/CutS family)
MAIYGNLVATCSVTEEEESMSDQKLPPEEQQPKSTSPAGGGITRRGFLKGAGVTAAGTALLEGVQGFHSQALAGSRSDVKEYGTEPVAIQLHINGKERTLSVEPRTTLADALRIQAGMTGTKVSCDRGACSSCTVWLDKVPINSCMTLALDAVGHQVTTIEGLSSGDQLHPVQAAFVRHDAMQCGFCTPGMVMSCASLLENNPHPTEADVRYAVSGNICRCGTYPKIFAATLDAANQTTRKA